MVGTSAALCLSGIPFDGPIGAVRVALVDGKPVANPTYAQAAASPLEIVIAGTEDAILMVESGGKEIRRGTRCSRRSPSASSSARCWRGSRRSSSAEAAKPRMASSRASGLTDPALVARVKELASAKVEQALSVHEKLARAKAMEAVFEEVVAERWAPTTRSSPKARGTPSRRWRRRRCAG